MVKLQECSVERYAPRMSHYLTCLWAEIRAGSQASVVAVFNDFSILSIIRLCSMESILSCCREFSCHGLQPFSRRHKAVVVNY